MDISDEQEDGFVNRPCIRVVSGEIVKEGRYLIAQRRKDAVLPDLWEFPGGRVREGETDPQALQRAVDYRLGCPVDVGDCVMELTHEYEGYTLILVVYRCELQEGCLPEAANVQQVAWVSPDEFGDYEFPGADQRTVDMLVSSMVD